jgi:bifunctional DNA-binding transcriptional regulator/antitoxin component of YhaV-PrlF toxin-antitoxin module
MARNRIRAEAVFISDRSKGGSRARVPAAIRDFLGVGPGDSIVFDEGCDQAVQRAALPGPYVVVSVKRELQPRAALRLRKRKPRRGLRPQPIIHSRKLSRES